MIAQKSSRQFPESPLAIPVLVPTSSVFGLNVWVERYGPLEFGEVVPNYGLGINKSEVEFWIKEWFCI